MLNAPTRGFLMSPLLHLWFVIAMSVFDYKTLWFWIDVFLGFF